jgi:preprotein translocase subunit SecE
MLRVRVLPDLLLKAIFGTWVPVCRECAFFARFGSNLVKRVGTGMSKIIQFFKECVAELRKVVWPTRDDVISSVKVVAVSTIIIAAILGLLDAGLVAGMSLLF